jgi:hypothetical protein
MKMYGKDGGIAPNDLNTRRLGTNILNKEQRTVERGWSYSLRFGPEPKNHRKYKDVTIL